MEISRELLIDFYRKMLLSRRAEEKIAEMYRTGLKGQYHLAIGQEAVAVGVCSALRKDDYILSTHRGKSHYIAKGGDLKAMMAEFLEKRTGCNRGKGGPMHVLDLSVGMLGANGIVGSSLPISVGVAFSAKRRRSGQVTVGFFGDGAVNCGPCHETMNLAGIWKLPLLFVCENNSYQQAVPFSRGSAVPDMYVRAAGYGFPGYKVDGMDVGAVYQVAREAVERARKGEGPTLIECKTYRYRGHSEADPTRGLSYRSAEEIATWEKRCPILKAQTLLLEKGWIHQTELEEIDQQCRQAVAEAIAFAESSPGVEGEWALNDVYTAI
jgi:TPP-dependent pyruvate/acetoin dehydrogenase alpha subunit